MALQDNQLHLANSIQSIITRAKMYKFPKKYNPIQLGDIHKLNDIIYRLERRTYL